MSVSFDTQHAKEGNPQPSTTTYKSSGLTALNTLRRLTFKFSSTQPNWSQRVGAAASGGSTKQCFSKSDNKGGTALLTVPGNTVEELVGDSGNNWESDPNGLPALATFPKTLPPNNGAGGGGGEGNEQPKVVAFGTTGPHEDGNDNDEEGDTIVSSSACSCALFKALSKKGSNGGSTTGEATAADFEVAPSTLPGAL